MPKYVDKILTGTGMRMHEVPSKRDFYIRYLKRSNLKHRVLKIAHDIRTIRQTCPLGKFKENDFLFAAALCLFFHRTKTRRISGEPFAVHPIELVEGYVADGITDSHILNAALLHDIAEDTSLNDIKVLERMFGKVTANLVLGMTKLPQQPKDPDRYFHPQDMDVLIGVLSEDMRIIELKMRDRFNNLKDAEHLKDASRIRNCNEALEFLVPLGYSCGYRLMARRLSDRAMEKLDPDNFAFLQNEIAQWEKQHSDFLRALSLKIQLGFDEELEIIPRFLTPFQIDIMCKRQNKAPHQLQEVLTIQIIAETEDDCYRLIGFINALGTHIDAYMRDKIADPYSNGRQSFQTGVNFGNGTKVRFEIMTEEMHENAEFGLSYSSFDSEGRYFQPRNPKKPNQILQILQPENIRAILEPENRYQKARNVRIISSAKPASLIFDNGPINILLAPRGVNAAELVCLGDPYRILHIEKAYHNRNPIDIAEPIARVSDVDIQTSKEIRPFDVFGVVKNSLAQLNLLRWLDPLDDEEKISIFSIPILKHMINDTFLSLQTLARYYKKETRRLLVDMAEGRLSGAQARKEIIELVQRSTVTIVTHDMSIVSKNNAKLSIIEDQAKELFNIHYRGARKGALYLSIDVGSPSQQEQLQAFLDHLSKDPELVIDLLSQQTT